MRAFLVLGPESSGNRLMLRILIACGAFGDGTHAQRLDRRIPDPPPELIAWGRSFPYETGKWPNIPLMCVSLQEAGYDVHALVMTRDMWATARSQVAYRPGTDSISQSYKQQRRAYLRIFGGLQEAAVLFTVVHYDALVSEPGYLPALLLTLGLEQVEELEPITNQNAKWYR